MKLIILLLAIAAILFSGCVNPDIPPAPSGQFIPIPITSSYIQNGSITDSKLAAYSIITNFTNNQTAGTVVGTTFLPIGSNATIQLNRTSALAITYTGKTSSNAANVSFIRATINNTASNNPTVALVNALPVAGGGQGAQMENTTVANWYNNSVGAGTYQISIQGNSSASGGILYYTNSTLMVVAYPK